MATLIIKSGTTAIAGATVKGSFSYFSGNTTKDLGPTSSTGLYSGINAPSGGFTVYQTGGPNGLTARVATDTNSLNLILIGAGGTGSTVDQNITWATNTNSVFINSGTTTSSSVLIGYYSDPRTYLYNCDTAFSGVTATLPLYVSNSVSGVTYTLGQLMTNNIYEGGTGPNIFYTDSNLTNILPTLFGYIYGFSPTSGGTPYRQIRLDYTGAYNGWNGCNGFFANGYMVQSLTLVNVGDNQRDWIITDDTSVPYAGKTISSSNGGSGFGTNQTWAWASQPNVMATHLFTFGSYSTSTIITVT